MDNDKKTGESEDEAILKASREGLQERIEAESDERKLMLDDLEFATLDQWPADIREKRENDVKNGPRPCLTIDQINQYITQVANDMRKNRPSIKTRPVDDLADPETAKIFQGLTRHIEEQSSAQVAYQTSGESATTIGLGYVRLTTDYISPDSFDQEILIKRVPDTFSVYLGAHAMPDGSDAEKAWVMEKVSLERFERDWPKAKVKMEDFDGLGEYPAWRGEKEIIICEYFYKEYTPATLYYLADGNTIYKDEYERLSDAPSITGERETHKVSIKWCKHTGIEVLEKRNWLGDYIPIAEEVGKEMIVKGKRKLWGLVRPAKDSLRAYNYWTSALTEKMALAPKAPFIGAVGQFASQQEQWDKANVDNFAKLEYDPIDVNGNALPAPRRQDPMQMEAGIAQLLLMLQNNVKSSLGMYKAAIGDTESQQSGRAILALQNESDTGTMHFGENQALTITHIGRMIINLAPKIYDTKRIIRILGEDGKVQNVSIDPEQKESMREVKDLNGKIKRIYNLGVGKYDVIATVGPGYATSRQEASTVMTELANSAKDPVTAAILRYGAVKNNDFHGSDEITRMLKAMLPPQLQQPDGEQEVPPAAMAKMAQMQQQGQMMQEGMQKLAQENQQLKTGQVEHMAKVHADHDAKMQELILKEQQQNEEARLAGEKAEKELALKIWVANQEINIKKTVAGADMQNEVSAMQHSQLCEKIDSIANLLKQFEVISQNQREPAPN